jgi:Na+/proline symporter
MNLVLACVLAYIASQLLVVAWFTRRVRSERDYLLAGRSLGPWLGTFSVFATWFGAETCIGAAGEAYAHGVSGILAEPVGYALGVMLMGLCFAAALWRRDLVTLADLFRTRYGIGVERLAALVMIPSSVMWAAAQVRGFGQVLASAGEFGLVAAMTLAAAVVVIYTVIGGMWADAVTDLVQGVVLIAGVLALFVAFVSLGGLGELARLPAERLNPMEGRSALGALDTLAVPVFSTIAAQELASRVLAMRGAALARGATVAAGALYLLVALLPVTIGLGAAAYVGADLEAEQILSRFAAQQLPLPLYILFLGALVSAILSTLSGALLVAGSLLAHNLLAPLRPAWSERTRVRADRAAVAVLGVAAYAIALASESMYALVQESSSIGTAGILVLLVFGLWAPRFGGAASAYAALVAGTGTYLAGAHVFGMESPYLVALATAFAVYVLAAPLARRAPLAAT